MSDILCRWLNSELRLSKVVEPHSFPRDFANGYLIGEILNKYQLQDDFDRFSKHSAANAKLNNFTRLEPTLQLLGVPFDLGMAKALMQGQQGAASRLLYQLYILLQKKKREGLTGTTLETMQPAATARLHRIENRIYTERLRVVMKRDADLKMQKIMQRFDKRRRDTHNRSVMADLAREEKRRHLQEEMRLQDVEKLRQTRMKQQQMMERIQLAVVQVPKPPASRSRTLEHQQQQEAQNVHQQITYFEKNRKRLSPASCDHGAASVQILSQEQMSQWNSEFMHKLHQRVEQDAVARTQREQRRQRALQQQLQTHHSLQEMLREEQLIGRLMRQSQQEKRIAVQLMQIRQQKEVLRQNRIIRERQYQEQRLRDFKQALGREAALLLQTRVEHQEQVGTKQQLLSQLAAERSHNRRRKHYNICRGILEQIVDLATKAGEYRLLTTNLIPGKLIREWKELVVMGQPLYAGSEGETEGGTERGETHRHQADQHLNEQDYQEYMSMTGEWAWPEGECKAPPSCSDILSHVVTRLQNMVNPPRLTEPLPAFSCFSLRACVLGKPFSGKTSCLRRMSEAHGICVLSADRLIQEVLAAHQAGEQEQNVYRPEKNAEICDSPLEEAKKQGEGKSLQSASDPEESSSAPEESSSAPDLEPVITHSQPGDLWGKDSKAKHGAVVENLRKGRAVSHELLVDIFIDAIRQVPAGQGWVLDGFPADITQARLLEKALGGPDMDQANKKRCSRMYNLAEDRRPPIAPPLPAPVLDLVVLLDLSDEQVLDRAARPQEVLDRAARPQEHTVTADQDNTVTPPSLIQLRAPSNGENLERSQIQHRIMGFLDTWPKLEKWYGEKQKILVKVAAEVDEDTLFRNVETILLNIITAGEKGSQDHSRRVSVSSVTASDDHLPDAPGAGSMDSMGWLYVDEPLAKEIPEYLLRYWENACSSYVSNVKNVMQNLRNERNLIIHHLYNIREDFKQYLQRPDFKQDFVCVWQRDYNSLPDDMRHDEETKAELHQRLDDLRERLWDICDERKEGAKQERVGVTGDGWLEDHTALLINHYAALLQAEVNRFQDTVHVLRDYYSGMYRSVLPDAASDFTCIPLLDVIEDNGDQIDRTKSSSTPSERLTKSVTLAGKKDAEGEENKKTKIVPLVLRRPPSSDPSRQKGVVLSDEKLLQDIYNTALTAVTSTALAEVQQLECEEHGEVQHRLEKERLRQSVTSVPAPPSAPPSAKDKKKAGKKKGPPSLSEESSAPPPLEEDAEEMERRTVRNRIRQEYRSALQHEEGAVKQRLALVQLQALATVHSVQQRAELTHSTMEEWLGARYLSEINSIDQLTELVRRHIEGGVHITHELRLESTDFFVDGDTRVMDSPPPPLRPPPLERTNDGTLTVLQLHGLCSQLCNIAPSGLMSSTQLCEVLQGVTYPSMHSDTLPEAWMHLTDSQIQDLVCGGFAQDCDMVDWRQFLVGVAQPWPLPSQNQLLKTFKHFRAIDTAGRGVITLDQYLQVELWFGNECDLPVPEDPTESLPYDRLDNLRKFFFKLFADPSSSPSLCDYLNMLLYFCCHPDPAQGFTRALSVVTQHTLSYTHTSDLLQSVVYMDTAKEGEVEEEEGEVDDEGCISIDAVLRVLQHGGTRVPSHHRFHQSSQTIEELQQDLVKVFKELGFKEEEKIPFSILSQHPFLQDLMESSTQYLLMDVHRVVLAQQSEREPV